MISKPAALAFVAALGLLNVASVRGQIFSSDWRALTGGGGISESDGLTLISSVASLETARVTAGSLVLVSGFIGAYLDVPNLATPVIVIASGTGGSLTVSWAPTDLAVVLQFTDSLSSATWQDAPSGNANPVEIKAAGVTRFFRLRSVQVGPES